MRCLQCRSNLHPYGLRSISESLPQLPRRLHNVFGSLHTSRSHCPVILESCTIRRLHCPSAHHRPAIRVDIKAFFPCCLSCISFGLCSSPIDHYPRRRHISIAHTARLLVARRMSVRRAVLPMPNSPIWAIDYCFLGCTDFDSVNAADEKYSFPSSHFVRLAAPPMPNLAVLSASAA